MDLVLEKLPVGEKETALLLLGEVFAQEQNIPVELLDIKEDLKPIWWCAKVDSELAGIIACWFEKGEWHLGRYAVDRRLRGLGIGKKLVGFSLNEIFNLGAQKIVMDARDITVAILQKLGAKVVGEPINFYGDLVTPMILRRDDYLLNLEFEKYTELLVKRFSEDPGVMFQIADLKRSELLLSLQFEAQIRAFSQHNAVRLLDDGKGLLIGYSTIELPEPLFLEVMQQSSLKLLEEATEEELLIMQSKAMLENEIIPQNWHTKYYDGEVFHLLVIAIDKSLKGTGAFRQLLMPVIKDCEKREMPIVLETFSPDNVPIYEHYGFQLMESHSSDQIDLTCFCMMRLGL